MFFKPATIIALAFLFGNLIVYYMVFEWWVLLAIGVLSILFFKHLFLKNQSLRMFILTFTLIIVWTLNFVKLTLPLPKAFAKDNLLWTTFRVLDQNEIQHNKTRLTVRLNPQSKRHRNAFIYFERREIVFQLGELWSCPIFLEKPHPLMNFSINNPFKSWLRNEIAYVGRIQNVQRCQRRSVAKGWYRWQQQRAAFYQSIRKRVNDPAIGALIAALVTGIRKDVTATQWQVFRDTGTSHLMAISGLHIALLATGIYGLIRFAWRYFSALDYVYLTSQVAACSAAIGALAYACLAGFSVATERAASMVVLCMLANCRNEKTTAFHTLLIALLITLLLDPLQSIQAGFLLSYGAVCVLFYSSSGKLSRPFSWKQGYLNHLFLMLGLLPITLYVFGQASLISIIANCIAIPWMCFLVVPWSLLAACLIYIMPWLATQLLSIVAINLQVLFWVLQILVSMYSLQWHSWMTSTGYMVIATLLMLWLLAPLGIAHRYLACLSLLPIVFPPIHQPAHRNVWLDVLDVGQGLAVVVRTQHHTLLYDTGDNPWHHLDRGTTVVLPFLKNVGIRKLAMVVLSHADRDHIGGYPSIAHVFPIQRLKVGDELRMKTFVHHKAYSVCRQGQSWSWDGVQFEVLHPGLAHYDGNDASCVLKVQIGRFALFLTGDISKRIETLLMKNQPYLSTENWLIAPHHGSRTASSFKFIQWLHPKGVIFATGYRNHYHFPHTEVLARYRQLGSLMYNTSFDGAIHLKFNPKRHRVVRKTYRNAFHPWWFNYYLEGSL